jgi:GNAT superfamily N-acetyltransferase
MSMAIEVRPAVSRDHERVAELTLAAYLDVWPEGIGEYDQVISAVAERAAVDEVLVAVADGEVVGSVSYVSDPRSPSVTWHDPGAVGLRLLAVSLEHRGIGAGRALLDSVLDRARAAGHSRVRLHTHAYMATAVGMYERTGFARDEAMDFVDSDGWTNLGYVLDLGSG